MRITKQSDYALRVLMYLCAYPKRSCTIKEISESFDISQNHLMKVVQHLAQHGFVKTIRGKNGGIWLGRPAEQILVGEVLRKLGEGDDLLECFREEDSCKISPLCALKKIFNQANEAFFNALNQYSLADIIGDRAAISNLLQRLPSPCKLEA